MATKVKGLFKGLRQISHHIFEDGKDGDIQIGYPTDVKHVAHIGFDGQGPSAESPSWMKEFCSNGYQSQPLGVTEQKDNAEIKWVSEDSKSSRPPPSPRHISSPDNSESPKKESSRRHSRRSKDSGGSTRSHHRQLQDPATGSESPSQLPDIPKKSRRRKSKENVSGGGGSSTTTTSTRSSRSKEGSTRKSQPSSLQEGEMESGANSPAP